MAAVGRDHLKSRACLDKKIGILHKFVSLCKPACSTIAHLLRAIPRPRQAVRMEMLKQDVRVGVWLHAKTADQSRQWPARLSVRSDSAFELAVPYTVGIVRICGYLCRRPAMQETGGEIQCSCPSGGAQNPFESNPSFGRCSYFSACGLTDLSVLRVDTAR
jgi:hypothetical protein